MRPYVSEYEYDVKFKKSINAPCVYTGKDSRTGASTLYYPAVDCGYGCDACGWNPIEKKRRLKTGEQKECRQYISAAGKLIKLPEGVMQLRFRPATK